MNAAAPIQLGLILALFWADVARAATNSFQTQTITLPVAPSVSRFVDINGDRRADLLAVDPNHRRLLIYRQQEAGFSAAPDQSIELPRQTAWIAVQDVDAQAGVELVFSTATGVHYLRQKAGLFESERRTLIKADQVFTNDDLPRLTSASNATITIISNAEAMSYERTAGFEWKAREPIGFKSKRMNWYATRNEWTVGPMSSHSLHIQHSFRARKQQEPDPDLKTEPFKKLFDELAKAIPRYHLGTNRVDLNGDGKKDLILWQTLVGFDPKTDVYVYVRNTDDKLPARPTQVLHCRGFSIPIGVTRDMPSIVGDLKGDKTYALILMELKTDFISADSVMNMVLSGGLECLLTIRLFDHGTFAASPSKTVLIRSVMPTMSLAPVEELDRWPFFICGDFNGDGRPDLVVKRSTTQWGVFFSTADGRWFGAQPELLFETQPQGTLEIADLNGDGRSDIVSRAENDPQIVIALSPPPRKQHQEP